MSDDKPAHTFTGVDNAFTRKSLYGTTNEHTFSGARSFMRRRYTKDLEGVDYAVAGVPFDLATTNRPGARFGPAAIRAASAHLSWGPPWPWGFDPFDRIAVVDYGDCSFDFGQPARIPDEITAHARSIVGRDVHLITLGGDHFVTLPVLRACAEKHGPLALVHFDAHSDTWKDEDKRTDHGTMFFHAVEEGIVKPEASVQVGIRTHNSDPLGFTWLDAAWVHEHGVAQVIHEIERLVGNNKAYLSFDIDCLDPACAPGTGTPVCGGLTTHQAQSIIRRLGNIDFVGMDMMEVAPTYDSAEITALAAASLILDYLCMRSQHLPDHR
jgi:agmatinase